MTLDLGITDDGGHPGPAWKELLDAHGITQAQVARQTHTSAKHINQIMQGVALPSAQLVVKMAAVLDASKHSHHDGGRRMARLMWGMQSRYVLEEATHEVMHKQTG